jgi:hypothetical protein
MASSEITALLTEATGVSALDIKVQIRVVSDQGPLMAHSSAVTLTYARIAAI